MFCVWHAFRAGNPCPAAVATDTLVKHGGRHPPFLGLEDVPAVTIAHFLIKAPQPRQNIPRRGGQVHIAVALNALGAVCHCPP